jgi:hypothetical protein
MSQIDLDKLDQEPWGSLITQVQGDVGGGQSPKILLCGSIFGGTGAAGLPTIGRLISKKLERLNIRDQVKVGCLFLLPYFGFLPSPGEDPDGVFARSEQFLLNTEAALRYYSTQAQEIFDTVYLLGNQTLSQVNFSIGKNSQRNQAHFVEIFAGLAARQFFLNTPCERGTVVLVSRGKDGHLTWGDLPNEQDVQSALVTATRFAYIWLSEIVPELTNAREKGFDSFRLLAPWLIKIFESGGGSRWSGRRDSLHNFDDKEQQVAIVTVSEWCKEYLRWLSEIHRCEAESIELFNANSLKSLEDGSSGDLLPELIIGDKRDMRRRQQDTPKRLKERLKPELLSPPRYGTVGLAEALYVSCQLY